MVNGIVYKFFSSESLFSVRHMLIWPLWESRPCLRPFTCSLSIAGSNLVQRTSAGMPKINTLPQKHLIRLICSGIREVDLARKEENLEDPQETFLLTKPSAVINDRPRCTNLTCTHSLSLSRSLSLSLWLTLSSCQKQPNTNCN